jgi:hypothetical protein
MHRLSTITENNISKISNSKLPMLIQHAVNACSLR